MGGGQDRVRLWASLELLADGWGTKKAVLKETGQRHTLMLGAAVLLITGKDLREDEDT